MATALIAGGTGDIGHAIATHLAERGDEVIITGRNAERAREVAAGIGGGARGIGMDLARPHGIREALEGVDAIDHVVLTASDPRLNTLADFDLDLAVDSVTIKLVGYAEAVHVLHPRMREGASVVLFGGLAKERPYPGSTMVTAFNAGISGLTKTLAREIAPFRVTSLHTSIVGDSPKWRHVPAETLPGAGTTPIGRLISRDDIAGAVDFLLGNGAVNGIDLHLDGGLLVA